jgi:hypothetical protein
MEFRKYSSIESTSGSAVNRAGWAVGPWVATEKADGSNFSIHAWADGTRRYGRRTDFLSDDEHLTRRDAQGWQDVVAGLDVDGALVEARRIRPGDHVILFGELIGPGVMTRVD